MNKESLKIFKCPKCGNKVDNMKCEKCGFVVPCINGVHYFTNDDNISLDIGGEKYIGYDDINIDFSPTLIYWGENHYGVYGAEAFDIVKRLGEGCVVLDIGCGLGTATIPFAEAGAVAIGADISKAMLEYSYKRSKGKYDNLFFCKMNAYHLMLEDASVDVVVENAMIHLVDNPRQVFEEIKRVLKPNGWFIRFNSKSLPITDEERVYSQKCYAAFKDIKKHYFEELNKLGYESNDFYNNAFEIQNEYFYTIEEDEYHPVLDYEEEFMEFMKFRVHRLEHKAHSFLQHIPDEIHKKAWELTDKYAKVKYGDDYKNMSCYSHYKACYDIYLKNEK